ncbi:MAG: O-antigen ligase family protein [Isosphaeraceae bacterium]
MDLRQRIERTIDRLLAATVLALLLGSAFFFGGAVWWFRPALAFLAFLLVVLKVAQLLIRGRVPFLKSPLTMLGLLVLALGIVQLVPLPESLARRLSGGAHEIYASGGIPRLARSDDPAAPVVEPARVRSPATLDRAATLRALVGAAACLGIFWSVSHFADRLRRLYLVSGCVVAAFLLNGALGLVQMTCHVEGLFGVYLPGSAPVWGPSRDDLLESPTVALMKRLDDPEPAASSGRERVALVPERPFLFGTLMGGPGAFLAFGSLAMPLALAIVLHLISPRGSRESLSVRLRQTGHGSLLALLVVLLSTSSALVGFLAGPWFWMPFALGVVAVGLPSAFTPPSRWPALWLTGLLLACLGAGAVLARAWPALVGGSPPLQPISWESTKLVWQESLPIFKDFPLVGTGLGSFRSIHPYYKTHDATATTAMSSLLQYGLESGAVGLGVALLAVLWSLCRLPWCVKAVGTADRTLSYGLIGAALSFSLWSSVHWTTELPAVAISASALGGAWNRWLAGGTDLFVERG